MSEVLEASDGREQGPKWALWNYETSDWDPMPEGYDPATSATAIEGTYGTTTEEMLIGMTEERGWFRRRRTVVVIAASAATLAAAAGVGGFAWWRGR